MNKLKFYFSIFITIMVQDIKRKLEFRVDFILSWIGMLILNIIAILTFKILFIHVETINNWNFNELLFLNGMVLLARTPLQMFFENLWGLWFNLINGKFIIYYFRPLNIFFYYCLEVFDLKSIPQFLLGVALIGYASYKLGINWNILNLSLFLLVIMGASLVVIGMMMFAAGLGFWIMNSIYFMNFMIKFCEYAKYPITIFNIVFKFIFTYLIPIAYISYYPSLLFIKPSEINLFFYISPIFGIFIFYLSYLFWMNGTRIYDGTGT